MGCFVKITTLLLSLLFLLSMVACDIDIDILEMLGEKTTEEQDKQEDLKDSISEDGNNTVVGGNGTANGGNSIIIGSNGTIIGGDGAIVGGNGSIVVGGNGGNYTVDENGNFVINGGMAVKPGYDTAIKFSQETYQNGIYTQTLYYNLALICSGEDFSTTLNLNDSIIKDLNAALESEFNVTVSFKIKSVNDSKLMSAFLTTDNEGKTKLDIIQEPSQLNAEEFMEFTSSFNVKGSLICKGRLYLYVKCEKNNSDTPTEISHNFSLKDVKIVISPAEEK